MSFVTRPNIDNRQFQQVSGSTFDWEGENNFVGKLKSKGVEIDADASSALSGFTLTFVGDKIKLKQTPNSDADFDSNRPTTRSGIPSVNVGGTTVTEFLEEYFFPSVPPDSSISVSPSNREFGDNSIATITWYAVRNTQPITSISIDNDGDTTYNINIGIIDGNSQNGTETGIFTESEYNPVQGTTQTTITYRIRVEDEIGDINISSTQIRWRHKRYWFKNSSSFTSLDATTIQTEMLNNSENELASIKDKVLNNYTLNGEYFYYAIPKHFGVPTFIVNGLTNNAWGNETIGTLFEISFTNSNGYIETYYIAKSDNAINGDFNIEIS